MIDTAQAHRSTGDADLEAGASERFALRFSRRRGLSGWFDTPSNTLGWAGSGRLSIRPTGVLLTGRRRGLLAVFPQQRFVTWHEVKSAYREGELIRLQFGQRAEHRLDAWAESAAEAASIASHLPAALTVELEAPLDASGVPTNHGAKRLLVVSVIAATAALLLASTVLFTLRTQSAADGEANSAGQRESVGHSPSPIAQPPRIELRDRSPAVRAFATHSDHLARSFRTALRQLMDGEISPAAFIEAISLTLIPRWREARSAALATAEQSDRDAVVLRELHAAGLAYERALQLYVEGLLEEQPEHVQQSFVELARAQRLEAAAYELPVPVSPSR